MRSAILCALVTFALSHFALSAYAQDLCGEITLDVPAYRDTVASAPIPPEFHIRNEGGSDGVGLCVISSLVINGGYQGVPGTLRGKDSDLWRWAKARPGGYYPEKLERLLKDVMPDEEWFSWEGDGTDLVEHYSALGYPIGATMSTGALYGYQPIHHMISLIHYDGNLACIVDNNDPGKYHWMPAAEFARRFPDGLKGWGFVWLRRPNDPFSLAAPAGALVAGGVALLVFRTLPPKRRAMEPCP